VAKCPGARVRRSHLVKRAKKRTSGYFAYKHLLIGCFQKSDFLLARAPTVGAHLLVLNPNRCLDTWRSLTLPHRPVRLAWVR